MSHYNNGDVAFTSLSNQQFKVEFKCDNGPVGKAFLDILNHTVKSVHFGLQKKFGEQGGSWYAITVHGFAHVLPAKKEFLEAFFEFFGPGALMDASISLVMGRVVLHTFEIKNMMLKIAGELKLGGPEQEALLSTVGVVQELIDQPTVTQLTDGSVIYNYEVQQS